MSTIASSIPTNHETDNPPTLLTTSTPNIICPICCEEEAAVVLSSCHHQSCGTCLVRWIDREEVSGRTSGPTCPFCRVAICDEDVLRILDRPFQPRAKTCADNEATGSDDEIDELTLHWINQNTMPCRVCGNRVERSDGCDHMECLCGHQFCYRCGGSYGSCRCVTPGNEFGSDVALTPLRDNDGFVDLRRCIQRSEVRQERLNRLNEEWKEWEHSIAFPSACTSNGRWLFSSTINARCITMLMHQLGHERIHYERDESSEWDDDDIMHPNIQNSAWVFLRHGADVKAMYQLFHRDDITEFRKEKLDEEREEWEHSIAFPSACTSNGRWLFSSTINARSITMLMHQLGHENIHYERKSRHRSREWDDMRHTNIQNSAWVFLRHGADVKAMYQLFHRDGITEFRKEKLDEERQERAYLEECWRFDFAHYQAFSANYNRVVKHLWLAIPNERTQEHWNKFSGELKRMEDNLAFNVWYNEFDAFHEGGSFYEESYEGLHRYDGVFYHELYRAAYDRLLRSIEIGWTIAHLNRFSGVLERMSLFSDHATYNWRHHSERWRQDLNDILRFERSSCCRRHCQLSASKISLALANDVTTTTSNRKWRGVGTRARMKLESKAPPRTVARWKRKKSLLAWSED